MPLSASQRGATYLALLFFVAIMGLVLSVGGVVWSTTSQRDKERELLFVGNQFRMAIGSYYLATPGSVKRYPATFADLLIDNRQAGTVRHLRRMFVDPMTATKEWGVVRAPDGGIEGVYSLSTAVPIKTGGFLLRDGSFAGAVDFAGWRFVYIPAVVPVRATGGQ